MRPACFARASLRVHAIVFSRRSLLQKPLSRSHRFVSTVAAAPPQCPAEPLPVQLDHDEAHPHQPLRPVESPRLQHKLTPISKHLPLSCPGCGALTQDVDLELAGYYTLSRRAVRDYLRSLRREERRLNAQDAGRNEYTIEDGEQSQDEANSQDNVRLAEAEHPKTVPVCDRCHHLIHDSRGVSIAHPSLEAIADSIAESPFTRNHVYHVLDAADFPMSLVPSIYKHLSLARPRTQNRRSQHSFSTRPTISFIITRSDLIAPTKEMVDSMMAKMTSILRTALGRTGEKLRLGNVHLVSSKRGWWTKDIKDTIRARGGGNWLVGKFNVGKSNLFEVLFPKGALDPIPIYEDLRRQQENDPAQKALGNSLFSEGSLLPPPQPEVAFPTMPLVSSLPGTTASPIRLPFGEGKGELIDMPGLERSGLEKYVKAKDKIDLVMVSRPTVSQHIIKHGQSLLIGGGLVRITPILDADDSSMTVLAYPFIPLKSHVTSTEKAEATQLQQRQSGIESILEDEAGTSMSSAGRFSLQTDVTKSRAGSMIRAGVNPEKLAFRVYATDILIEGIGWVELVCQVSKYKRATTRQTSTSTEAQTDVIEPITPIAEGLSIESNTFTPFGENQPGHEQKSVESSSFPEVEIFTPNGKYIGQRPCLGIWQMWNTGKPQKDNKGARPRRPMSGAKKRDKIARRAALKTG